MPLIAAAMAISCADATPTGARKEPRNDPQSANSLVVVFRDNAAGLAVLAARIRRTRYPFDRDSGRRSAVIGQSAITPAGHNGAVRHATVAATPQLATGYCLRAYENEKLIGLRCVDPARHWHLPGDQKNAPVHVERPDRVGTIRLALDRPWSLATLSAPDGRAVAVEIAR